MATQLNNMGEIIGWKFNHMSGMSTYDGWITEFPSGVSGVTYADGIPNDANIATWKTEYELATAWSDLRQTRDAKLAESDYMGNSDVTMSSAWKTYRKALRDLPGTLNDTTVLETITWPTEPS